MKYLKNDLEDMLIWIKKNIDYGQKILEENPKIQDEFLLGTVETYKVIYKEIKKILKDQPK